MKKHTKATRFCIPPLISQCENLYKQHHLTCSSGQPARFLDQHLWAELGVTVCCITVDLCMYSSMYNSTALGKSVGGLAKAVILCHFLSH